MGINEETVLRALLYALDAAINDKDHMSVDYFSKAYQRVKSVADQEFKHSA